MAFHEFQINFLFLQIPQFWHVELTELKDFFSSLKYHYFGTLIRCKAIYGCQCMSGWLVNVKVINLKDGAPCILISAQETPSSFLINNYKLYSVDPLFIHFP